MYSTLKNHINLTSYQNLENESREISQEMWIGQVQIFHSCQPLWSSNLLCNLNEIWPTNLLGPKFGDKGSSVGKRKCNWPKIFTRVSPHDVLTEYKVSTWSADAIWMKSDQPTSRKLKNLFWVPNYWTQGHKSGTGNAIYMKSSLK